MNVLLKIGHQNFLLPNTTGVENLMRVMAKAIKVYDRTWDDDPRIEVDSAPVKVEMKMVAPGTRFVGEKSNAPVEVWTSPARQKQRNDALERIKTRRLLN